MSVAITVAMADNTLYRPERVYMVCEWDVEGGEMRPLEDLLRGMLAYGPQEKLTTEELVKHEYMVKWAVPAWERQLSRQGGGRRLSDGSGAVWSRL
jgi:hypothetical protein